MTHRRKNALREIERRQKEEQMLRGHRNKRIKQGSAVAVSVVVLVLLGWQLSLNAPPQDWIQCVQGTVIQHRHYWFHVQIGEKVGEFNQSFIRIPEGLGIRGSCHYPVHTHSGPEERDLTYTRIHVEAGNDHSYSLADLFSSWSKWMDYPAPIYFAWNGVSYYRTQNFEMVVNGQSRGGVSPSYVPSDGERIDLIVHEPFQVVPGPYPGGELPIDADFTSTLISGRMFAFYGSASGGVAPYAFEWDFQDGTARATGVTPVHTFTGAGEYLVAMYVTDAAGVLVKIQHIVQPA